MLYRATGWATQKRCGVPASYLLLILSCTNRLVHFMLSILTPFLIRYRYLIDLNLWHLACLNSSLLLIPIDTLQLENFDTFVNSVGDIAVWKFQVIFISFSMNFMTFSCDICILAIAFFESWFAKFCESGTDGHPWSDGVESKKISNDQELIQSDPISCPQNQKGSTCN